MAIPPNTSHMDAKKRGAKRSDAAPTTGGCCWQDIKNIEGSRGSGIYNRRIFTSSFIPEACRCAVFTRRLVRKPTRTKSAVIRTGWRVKGHIGEPMDRNRALGGSSRGVRQTGKNRFLRAWLLFSKPFKTPSLSFPLSLKYMNNIRNLCRDLFKLRVQLFPACYGCLHFAYRPAPSSDLIPLWTKQNPCPGLEEARIFISRWRF